MSKKTSCESCLMPFGKDPGTRESDKYCSLCYKDGKLCYEGDNLKEFQKRCYEAMIAKGMNKRQAKFLTCLIRFAPRWRKDKWQNSKAMRTFRIFLLVLIITGLILLATQSFWVPKLVDFILTSK